MPDHAEPHSATIETNRNCTVEMVNLTSNYCLLNPQVYMDSGFAYSPPQPTLIPGKTEVFSFTKDDNNATGAVGVVTYDFFNTDARRIESKLALMFSVPYDYNFYKNWLSVGIFDVSTPCDEKLYDKMYNDKDFTNFVRQKADGSGIKFTSDQLVLRATMNDDGKAIVKLDIFNKM
ncbi:DELTA-thalatoxin-Avl1b-like [Gouania willdenowi]|uniref:DELTA-thalatoxin-Avl1b-like n=1 Tax=Gouania willdenowi TaxID=441366 RepID=A0A8C5GTT3_GOUWI|nr:DELTA-thalatoxin-Avl1b-like [Gouania willdenowi]XP_028332163.1 DELTA-thalatoxin-Avl1b-like [Gouania willdenowi]